MREDLAAPSTPEAELVAEAHARLRQVLLEVYRAIAGYIPRLPAGIESAWHRHLNTDSFSFGSPRLPDLLPMVASVTAIRLLNGATTQEERDAAARLLREAADCVDQHEITRDEAFRHLMIAAVSKQMNLSPADADRFLHQVTHIQ